jgi:hypothetical protein
MEQSALKAITEGKAERLPFKDEDRRGSSFMRLSGGKEKHLRAGLIQSKKAGNIPAFLLLPPPPN